MAADDLQRFRTLAPFLFPGSELEETEPVEPPLHEDLQDYAFFEVYAFIFEQMRVGERIIDTMKRIHQSDQSIDDMAKWVSELFARGEVAIIETDWAMAGVHAGKVGWLQELKWDLEENGVVTSGHSAETLKPRARVLAAEDARVRIEGTENWVPVEKINFAVLVL
jgi:hypothetical protein